MSYVLKIPSEAKGAPEPRDPDQSPADRLMTYRPRPSLVPFHTWISGKRRPLGQSPLPRHDIAAHLLYFLQNCILCSLLKFHFHKQNPLPASIDYESRLLADRTLSDSTAMDSNPFNRAKSPLGLRSGPGRDGRWI